MKVIFLDNDGVMCLAQQWGSRYKKQRKVYTKDNPKPLNSDDEIGLRFDNFDKKAVHVLNEILDITGAEIVVSSDWKLHASLDEMKLLFSLYKVNKQPIDFTPRLKDVDEHLAGLCSWKGWLEQARCEEIRHWLKNHPEVTHWVAIDDMPLGKRPDLRDDDGEWGLDNFVQTPRSNEGIKQSGIKEKILSFLS